MTDHMTKTLDKLAAEIVEDGIIDANEVQRIRERIYADKIIDRQEADFLFKLNDAVSGANNDPSWKELFVEALTAHVLEDVQSPGVVDADEAAYLIEKIKADEKVDEVELALLVNITATAQKCHESLNAFVLEGLKASVLEDGIIDDDEVKIIKKVIYGTGGAAGARIDRTEADFLFDLNDATSGKNNSPAWKDLFVEAISKHVLEDELSPGVVDEEEANWLIGRIEGDATYDDNEKALLAHIKTNAKKVHPKLKFKLNLLNIG
ncbi:MAG: hypothetical protein DDT30_00932 [Dehalococcoidia bacterium]|nr:hypothetical protein [Bacillota bacterium]MBT9142533.1 hypothetical protein [Bacillota bacterium]